MGDSSQPLKLTSDFEDWCPKDDYKLELRLGPPGEDINCALAKPTVLHKRVGPAPVVGWPPVRSFRKNMSFGISAIKIKSETLSESPKQELLMTSDTLHSNNNGLFVKINMDGVPIGRKIDLQACESYEKLSKCIDDLFRDLLAAQSYGVENKVEMKEEIMTGRSMLVNKRQEEEYTLVYEDSEGDRMLVGDVPWHMFVSAATRLRVMRTSELHTLSLGSMRQEKKG